MMVGAGPLPVHRNQSNRGAAAIVGFHRDWSCLLALGALLAFLGRRLLDTAAIERGLGLLVRGIEAQDALQFRLSFIIGAALEQGQ
jgi:hypothetical protein